MVVQGLSSEARNPSGSTNGVRQQCVNTDWEKVLQDVSSDAKGTVLQEFYRDTNIFITGATGFMGKVLVEKLLRGCPRINKIYLLIRNKKEKSAEERLEEIYNVPLFDRLRLECPDFQSKLHVIKGDIGQLNLGISDDDRHLLSNQIHVVFHVGATVRFNEKLSIAVAMNVRGTREVMSLARSCNNLKSCVHVSTAYSQCVNDELEERYYLPPMASDALIKLAETTDPDILDSMSARILGSWLNTYTYTKSASEDAVIRYGQNLPVGVYRPSVVTFTSMEPMSGWSDNLHGPSGIILGTCTGLIKTMHFGTNEESNVVPCDLAINSLIATAWDIAENKTSKIPFYNYVVPKKNTLTWGTYVDLYIAHALTCCSSQAIWYPMTVYVQNKILALLCRILLHYIPGLIMDLFLVIRGQKPRLFRLYQKIHRQLDLVSPFSLRSWTFKHNNIDQLWKKLEPTDKEIFDFNMMSLNWAHFTERTAAGMHMYLLKEKDESITASRNRMKKLKLLHQTTVFFLYTLSSWLMWTTLLAIGSKFTLLF